MAREGRFLPSSQAHKAARLQGSPIWIIYVNLGKVGYRLLADMRDDGTLILDRVLNHAQMDRYLRSLLV